MSSIFSRTDDQPGLQGTLRDCTAEAKGKGFKRLGVGDIAVINSPDLSRREAQLLVNAQPAAVINLSKFSTGSIPNFGPHMLLDAGILLIEDVDTEARESLRGGKKSTVTADGEIYVSNKPAGKGTVVDRESADRNFSESQTHLVDHMEAYFGNTIEFIHSEAPLLIDGVGVPDLGDEMADKKVLIVSPEAGHRDSVINLRNFIREYDPIIIGVAQATDTLAELGYKPNYIVSDPNDVSNDSLRGGARVILPADPDGHAVGLERIQDLGVGAMTFPSALDSPMDLAVLLAVFHDAQMIVTVGDQVDLDAIFAGNEDAGPSSMLTRLKGGARIVDSQVIEDLYHVSSGRGVAWAWALFAVLVAIAVIILVAGLGGDDSFGMNLINTWNNIALTVQSWFN
ncbi:putative cytokinetic ring protein SteA [Corynebacterium lubricantis]|uniref:putative cytokinetic ring protein SteA n=1 Tax=Corynebacterium lubricantis TaxID=541095 RepID=UPI00037C3CC6|nr:putative cytokinetic ring protein SteA [Corynebacterium lubricantis]